MYILYRYVVIFIHLFVLIIFVHIFVHVLRLSNCLTLPMISPNPVYYILTVLGQFCICLFSLIFQYYISHGIPPNFLSKTNIATHFLLSITRITFVESFWPFLYISLQIYTTLAYIVSLIL